MAMGRPYTIGAAARLTGVDARRLRAWDAAGLIAPRRTPSGYRLFTEADLHDIARVRGAVATRGRFGAHLLAAVVGEPEPPASSTPGTASRWTAIARCAATSLERPWAAIILHTVERGAYIAGAWGRPATSSLGEEADAWTAALLSSPLVIPDTGFAGLPADWLVGVEAGADGWRAVVLCQRDGSRPTAGVSTLLAALVASQRARDVDAMRLERARAELDAIARLAALIARERELHALLDGALDVFLELSGLEMGGVLLADRSRRRLLTAATRNVSPRYLEGIRNWRADEGIIGRAHTNKAPVTTTDLCRDPRVTRKAVRDEGVGAFVGVPLLHRDRSLGVIELGARVPRRFAAHEVATLARCAEQLAVGIAALQTEQPQPRAAKGGPEPGRDQHVPGLSSRQLSILQLLAESYSTSEVAALLEIAPKTVANALTTAFRALGVANRTQAVTEAVRLGLVASPRR
jgi:DNA-binding CsgD family transcriptional regulator